MDDNEQATDVDESEADLDPIEGEDEGVDGAADGGHDEAASTAGERNGRRRRRQEPDLEPTDERMRQALAFVTDVVREMELDCRVRLRRPREGDSPDEINIDIAGRDAGLIIGKKGQVLQALQFLTHRVVNRPGSERRHVLVDAEGYRSRRGASASRR
jgi:predicted RNA-binding protein Jag